MIAMGGSPHPPARSFQLRRRGLSAARMAEYREHSQRWSLPVTGGPLRWTAEFPALPADADVVLDIGFGSGDALIAAAAARPHEAVVGVEVHTPGVARVLAAIAERGWQHVRVVEGDVLELLPRVPGGSLAAVRMFFPDPWPKNKQRHRRLARPEVVAQLVDRLRIGGVLHIATDSAAYGEQAQRVCALEVRLRGGRVPRPEWRPLTRFEARGLAAGRAAIDLIYTRVS